MSISLETKINMTPEEYADAAVLAREAGREMLARLDWVTLNPEVILDAGCGTGYFSGLLQQRYPDAKVIAMDIAYPMLEYVSRQEINVTLICADAEVLPLKNQSVDLVFANMTLPWCDNVENLWREWRRILRPNGLLVFTGLGPDTLRVWRETFKEDIQPRLSDMHNLGDALTRAKFAGPVLDTEYFTLVYQQAEDFFRELKASGMLAVDADKLAEDFQDKRTPEGFLPATYEVVYAHAFKPEATAEPQADEFGTVRIPLAHLRGRR